jgi:hypothetical protein
MVLVVLLQRRSKRFARRGDHVQAPLQPAFAGNHRYWHRHGRDDRTRSGLDPAARAGRKRHEPACPRPEHVPGREADGAPLRKLSPRGGDSSKHPTINRWEYSSFIVYFEMSHVIHAVLNTPAGNNTNPASVN